MYLPVEYPGGVDAQPRDDPGDGEAHEHEVAHLLVVGVLAQLSTLKKREMSQSIYLKIFI